MRESIQRVTYYWSSQSPMFSFFQLSLDHPVSSHSASPYFFGREVEKRVEVEDAASVEAFKAVEVFEGFFPNLGGCAKGEGNGEGVYDGEGATSGTSVGFEELEELDE